MAPGAASFTNRGQNFMQYSHRIFEVRHRYEKCENVSVSRSLDERQCMTLCYLHFY